jgi:hypothetical protein
MPAVPKNPPIRDRKYLDSLRDGPCVFTGARSCDPAHIGQMGMGAKSSDAEALPVSHDLHVEMHQRGEMTVLRERASDTLLREMARAYARELYRRWKDGR